MQTAEKEAHTAQNAKYYIDLEAKYGAHNYKPVPVVLSKGQGSFVWDVEGNRYFDFLSSYSAVNQGHCHPRLVEVMQQQCMQITLTSRAFYNDKLGLAEEFLAKTFGFDKVLLMNSGAEAVESALKLARKWGYTKKGIADGEAVIVAVENNFHGRTTAVISFSTDEKAREGFGPFNPGSEIIPYNDIAALEKALQNPNVCAFLFEPIQGEAGVIVPDEGYLQRVRELCTKHNVLMLADEIQTGLARTGKMLCVDYEDVRPDVLILGKALSGGMMPVSAVLCDDEIMLTIQPGEHGSTFGGNPLAAAIAIESVKIIQDEELVENSYEMGKRFRQFFQDLNSPLITEIRGRGLLNAIRFDEKATKLKAWDICLIMKEHGVLAKQTHNNVIRFAPPLIITKDQMEEACGLIARSLEVALERG